MAHDNCYEEALAGLKSFDREDLRNYYREVYDRAKEIDNSLGAKAFQQAMDEINNTAMQEYFFDAQTKANDIAKFSDADKLIKDQKANLQSFLIRRWDNKADNVEAVIQSRRNDFEEFNFRDLDPEEMQYLQDKRNQFGIAAVFDETKVASNPVEQKLADKLKAWFPHRNSELLISNAMNLDEFSSDRYFKTVHDQLRISKVSPDAWKEDMYKHFDVDKTFRYSDASDDEGNIDMAKADKITIKNHKDIVIGKSDLVTNTTGVNDSQVQRRKGRMFWHVKSLSDQLQYNEKYGTGDLFSMLRSDINSSARKAGVAQKMGSNPNNFYNDLRESQIENTDHGIIWYKVAGLNFDAVTGADLNVSHPTIANLQANSQMLLSMARLGAVAFDSVPDTGFMSAYHTNSSGRMFEGYLTHLSRVFGVKTPETRYVAESMKFYLDTTLGHVGRWADANNGSSFLQKITSGFFRANLLHGLDQAQKEAGMATTGKIFYDVRDKSWDALHPAQRHRLSQFMDRYEWDAIRKQKQPVKIITQESAQRIPDEDLKELNKERGESRSYSDLRDEISRKIFAMYTTTAENMIQNPMMFENLINLGTKAGGAVGTPLRVMMHFKKFGMAYVDRVLMQGFANAKASGTTVQYATTLFAGTVPLVIAANYIKNLLMGKDYHPLDQWHASDVWDRFAMMNEYLNPSLGLYSIMLNKKNLGSSYMFSPFQSPGTRFISDTASGIMASAATGWNLGTGKDYSKEKKLMKKNFRAAANYMLPLQNVPILTPIFDAAFGSKVYTDPGQHQLGWPTDIVNAASGS